jgi:hypothetical protein
MIISIIRMVFIKDLFFYSIEINFLSFEMGVCIGICAREERMAPDVDCQEKKQIEKNVRSDAFDNDNCNIKTN